MTDSPFGRVLATGLSVLLACTASVVARSMPDAAPPPGTSAGSLVVGRDVSWPNCPKGLGIPSRPHAGQADAAAVGALRGDRADQRPGVPPEPVPGRAGRLRPVAAPVGRGVRRGDLPDPRQRGATAARPHGGRERGRLRNRRAQARQNVAAMRAVGLRLADRVGRRRAGQPAGALVAPACGQPGGARRGARGLPAARVCGSGSTPPRRCGAASSGRSATGFPEWRTAGLCHPVARRWRAAPARLVPGRPGGATQWYSPREDFDVLCPGRPADDVLAEYFTRL